MSAELKELGTLIVVIGKARNLPNKSRFGKQDPFCTVTVGEEKQRTKAIKRGGQHPEWDEEHRFVIHEDVDDVLVRSESQPDSLSTSSTQLSLPPKDQPGVTTPAALESKSRKGPIKKKGGKSMRVACYADDAKEPELIGECVVGIDEVLKKGEVDEWYEFLYKDKYSGEVYLELTFYSNDAPPIKRNVPRPSVHNLGGSGGFDPLSTSSSSSLSSKQRLSGGLAASGSVSGMSLYIPPYVQPARVPSPGPAVGAVPPSSSFAELGLPPGHSRKQSLTPSMPSQSIYSSSSISSHASSSTLTPHHISHHSIDALTRPMSSMSIGSSYSSRPLPPTSPAPPPQASSLGYNHASSHRHSVGGQGEAPWQQQQQQQQTRLQSHTPLPRPLSSNDSVPWELQQRLEDARRSQAATPVPRPVSGQGYAALTAPYGNPVQAAYQTQGDQYRAPSSIPPSLLPAAPPPRPHASSFSHPDGPPQMNGYLQPSPAPTPPPHSNSAPPDPPPSSHYQIPSSSFSGIPPDPQRSSTPQPPHRQSYDSYQSQPPPPPQQNGYHQSPGDHGHGYTGAPSRSNSYPVRHEVHDSYQGPKHGHEPYQSPSQDPASYQPPWKEQQTQYRQDQPPQPPAPTPPQTTGPGGYVPWYMQTQSTTSTPPPPPPPPVPSQYRPVPNPPAPPKSSVGYYPSDELYAIQRQSQQYPPQSQQQPQQQGYDQQYSPAQQQGYGHAQQDQQQQQYPPQPQSYDQRQQYPPAPPHQYQPQQASYPPPPNGSLSPAPHQPFSPQSPSRAPTGWQPTVAQGSHAPGYGRSPSPNPAGAREYGRSPSPNPQPYGRSPSPAPPPLHPAQYPSEPAYGNDPSQASGNYYQAPPPPQQPPPFQHQELYPADMPPAPPPRSPSPMPPPKDNHYSAASSQPQAQAGHRQSTSVGNNQDWRSYLGGLNAGAPSSPRSGQQINGHAGAGASSGGGGVSGLAGGQGSGGVGGGGGGRAGEIRSPSPQPGWYTPPPNLPASIRPPEGWRSSLPVEGEGHRWQG